MDLGLWRDIAVVWLALLCFIGMILPLGLAFFAVKGMHVAVDRLPLWLGQAQRVSKRVRSRTEQTADQVAAPIIATERQATRLNQFVRRLFTGPPSPR